MHFSFQENTALVSLNLAANKLCGSNRGKYDAHGIIALAGSLEVTIDFRIYTITWHSD
jgi:hypothetical protein